MPLYLYQAAYTPGSLAVQIKKPADRLEVVGGQLKASAIRIIGGGYCFGDYDIMILMDAPDDSTMAAASIAIAAGGAVRSARTTRLLSGGEFVEALKKASTMSYKPAG
jgi:uncharacterized protein with GYD domain